MKSEVVAVKYARVMSSGIYSRRLASVGVDVARLNPGPEESRGFLPSRTPPIPLPIKSSLFFSFFLFPPRFSRFSPCVPREMVPTASSREHKIQPGILISMPLCRAVLVPTDDFDLA